MATAETRAPGHSDTSAESFRMRVHRCANRLAHAASLALIAAGGPEPEAGAQYIITTLEDVQDDLDAFRAAYRQNRV